MNSLARNVALWVILIVLHSGSLVATSIQFDFGTTEGIYTGIESPAHQVGELTALENKWNAVGTTLGSNFPEETQPSGNDSLSFVYADGSTAFGIETDFGAYFDGPGATMQWDANESFLAQFGTSQSNVLYNNSLGKDLIFNPHTASSGSVAFRARGFAAGTYEVFAINTLSARTSDIRMGINMDKLADDTPESVGPIALSTTWVQGENYGRQLVSVTGPSDWITVFSTVTSGPNSVLSGVQITSDVPPPPPPPPVPIYTPNATRTESFNTALSTQFVDVNAPRANGQDFGFSNTNHAGGTPGEAGGTFVRTSSADAYSDIDLTNGTSGDFDRTKTLTLSGKFSVTGSSTPFNTVFVGYANDTIGSSQQFIGLMILEASPGVFRGQLSIQQADGTLFKPLNNWGIQQGVDYTFDLTYVGNPDGSGILSGTLGGDYKDIFAPASSDRFDKFGIGAGFNSSNDSTNMINAFFDDLTYSIYVPEPSAFMLSTSGLLALVARRRRAKLGGRCRSES